MVKLDKENMCDDLKRITLDTDFEFVDAGSVSYVAHRKLPIAILPPKVYGGEARVILGNPKMEGDTPKTKIEYFTKLMRVRDELRKKGYTIPTDEFVRSAFPYGNFSGYLVRKKVELPADLEKIVKDCDRI